MATSTADGQDPSFADLLRRHRMTAGVTQEELADRAQLSVRGLRYLEQGLHLPYQDTPCRLVAVLNLPPEDGAALAAAARSRGRGAGADGRDTLLPVPPTP